MANSPSTETRLLYDRKEAARQLSVSVRTIDYLVANKELDTRRIGKKVLVTRASLVKYASGNHFEVVKKGVASESTATLSEASSKCA
jgi:excisionase family DNA binding protein